MRLSSGVRVALGEAGKWLAVSAVGIVTFVWFDELKAGFSQALDHNVASRLQQAAKQQEPDDNHNPGQVTLEPGEDGHFTATALINGHPVSVLIDTGASIVALSHEDAERVGVRVSPGDFTKRVQTANGIAKVAPILLESIKIGEITLYNIEAAVSEPGRLGTTLLGMTFIGRLSRAEMRGGVLILQK
jgi:aspartyl protease family protein|nr:MAG: TIGR02281 family clan AA aspartic protease [Pseudomonadota bacterium]